MQASVGANIVVRDYTEDFLSEVEKQLVFPNPEYYRKQQLGKYVGNVPKDIVLYQKRGTDLILPFGMIKWCFDHREYFDGGILNALATPKIRFNYKSNIIPYEYQEKAILEALRVRNGVIVAPCGSGKTQIALELAARIGMKMLWITHTVELMNQSMERAKSVYGLSKEDYGTITGGKVSVGRIVTFATVQTLANIDLSTFKNYWQVVIVDECHKAVGTPTKLMVFWKVVSSLAARYKFGVTATAKRSDGLINTMFALLGGVVYEVSKDDVKDTTCPIKVSMRQTNFNPDMQNFVGADGMIDRNKLLDTIICDAHRNSIICEDVEACEKPCMILTDRVVHAEFFKWFFGERARLLTGSEPKMDRKIAIKDLKDGRADIVIATYPIAKEGLDIPQLRSVVLATPTKNEVTVVQSCGRVGRKCEGKDFGTVYDYVDTLGILQRQTAVRKKIYKNQNYVFTF